MFVRIAAVVLVTSATAAEISAPWTPGPLDLSASDRQIIARALARLEIQVAADPSFLAHVKDTEAAASGNVPLGVRQLAVVGMALSRSSFDLQSCALMRRIQPSAVCIK